MGPAIPLNFFMTRLLFMDQAKVDSLKAKNDRKEVEIIVDNPRILPEPCAKSLPPIPCPRAAPESPKSVEGWKGVKVGGWLCLGKVNAPPIPPPDLDGSAKLDSSNGNVVDGSNNDTTPPDVTKLSIASDDNDDTEMTEESSTIPAAAASTTDTTKPKPVVDRPPALQKLFPQNSKRNVRSGSNPVKKGGSLMAIARPSLKKRGSSKSKQMSDSSSPSNSGAEDN